MKKILYFFSFVLIILVSCKQEKNTGTPEPDIERKIPQSQSEQEDPETEPQFVENDSLTRAWVAELEMISTAEDKFEVDKKLTENRHIENQTDTIKTLRFEESTLRIYTTTGLYALESAEIEDEEFALQDSVEVGMSKDQLEQVLSTELKGDVIEVGNFTRNMHFTFYFKDDIVQRIEFSGYVD